MELTRGQIVRSRKGRDVGHCYVVLAVEGEGVAARALLCDGRRRSLNAPKQKNLRHIQPTNRRLNEEQLADDVGLRKALEWYEEQTASEPNGG